MVRLCWAAFSKCRQGPCKIPSETPTTLFQSRADEYEGTKKKRDRGPSELIDLARPWVVPAQGGSDERPDLEDVDIDRRLRGQPGWRNQMGVRQRPRGDGLDRRDRVERQPAHHGQ